eukprot:comp11601_c0_seq1/m.6087 comp11601_c0_seq1/g.6087  ORF comp11601_c0_seq1/g.6087 comp11601_c0_seq1/m.6087 type:complete len:561 (-) comp11601_c0_seq1:107-1789(-)
MLEKPAYAVFSLVDKALGVANVATKTVITEVWNATADSTQSAVEKLVSLSRKTEKDSGKLVLADPKSVSPPGSPTAWRLKTHRDRFDRAHKHEKITTGLMEDLQVGALMLVDRSFNGMKELNRSAYQTIASTEPSQLAATLNPIKVTQTALHAAGACVRVASHVARGVWEGDALHALVDMARVDTRTHAQMVEDAGYPYECYEVITDDGYVNVLERLPRPGAKKAVYLQHGVSDNSATFISTGTIGGLAYRLWDEGFDVYLGNFRGTRALKHIDQTIAMKDYWKFTPNDHAFRDIPAFLRKIRAVQRAEATERGEAPDEYTVTLVSHSMGATSSIMWVVHAGLTGQDHMVNKMVLLSPAGYHEKCPLLCRLIGPIIYRVLPWLTFVHSFGWPNETIRVVAAKLMEDVASSPPLLELVSAFLCWLLGTPREKRGMVVDYLHNFTYNTFTGTSVGVFNFFWLNYVNGKFLGWDFGPEGNMIEYGTPYPTSFMDNYHVIDIPTWWCLGLEDNLIYPENIIKQYQAMYNVRPELGHLKAFDSGHIDFCYGLDEELWQWIVSVSG